MSDKPFPPSAFNIAGAAVISHQWSGTATTRGAYGPLHLEPSRVLAMNDGVRTWYYVNEPGAHGEGVYSAGEALLNTTAEIERAVAAERAQWRELVGQLVACHEDESCPAVRWGRAVLAKNISPHQWEPKDECDTNAGAA